MSFCFLYNVVSENYSVQNSPRGGGGLLPAQGLMLHVMREINQTEIRKYRKGNVSSGVP